MLTKEFLKETYGIGILDFPWETEDGRIFKVGEMSINHVLNTIKFLKRQDDQVGSALKSAWDFLCMLQGEMAQLDVERGIRDIEDHQDLILSWINIFDLALDYRLADVTRSESRWPRLLKRLSQELT